VGRRAARPVDQLVRAVDAVAAGEEDYSFSGMPQDEFDALVTAFSNLQRSLEKQQRRTVAAERVAAWQEVARHVAHEVKNPLVPIRLTVENLRRARRERPEAFDRMFDEGSETILEEVDQLSRLVTEFSEFARLPLPDRRPTSLGPLLHETVDLFDAEPLTVERAIAADLPRVSIDRDQIARVFKNILGNSAQAVEGRRDARLRVAAAVRGDSVEIVFEDDGPGFAPEAERRVFEPYFTTKQQGTGLGMAISYRLVAEHDGEILAENRAEGGARVVVRVPWIADGAEEGSR